MSYEYIKSIFFSIFKVLILKLKSLFISIYNFFFGKETDVCIVKIDHIGDFIIWLGVANQIRNYYKDKKITLFCSSAVISVAEKSGLFDRIIGYKNMNDISLKISSKELIGIVM